MWRACRSLNSCRRFAAMIASSPTRVVRSLLDDAGELMDGFEFPDILQRWKMQRGSRQKVAWVWRCSTTAGAFLVFRRFAFFLGFGEGWLGVSRFHVGGGKFQNRKGETRGEWVGGWDVK